MSPVELLAMRFSAFQQKDFAAIYRSYHPDAPFLGFFPDCSDYVEFAERELSGIFLLLECHNLRQRTGDDGVTDLLFLQKLLFKGEPVESLEIGRFVGNDSGEVLYLGSLRLDRQKIPEDLLTCSWESLLAAGDEMWV